MVGQQNARLDVINQTALGAGADKPTSTDIKSLAKQVAEIEQDLKDNKQQSKNLSSVLNIIIPYTRHMSSGHKAHAWNHFLSKAGVENLVPDHIGLSNNSNFHSFVD